MRRRCLSLALLVLAGAANAWAVGSLAVTRQETSPRVVRLAWTSDAAGAVSGNLVHIEGVIERVVFVPGTGGVQPSDLYDVVLNDVDGLDVLAAKGANLSNATKTQVCPFIGDGTTTNKPVAVAGPLDLVVAAAGDSKSGTVVLYVR